jgi:tRNA (guanine-N7-)-methyltransferase
MNASNRNRPYDDVPKIETTGEVHLAELFDSEQGAFELEIGFGRGHFLLGRAANHRDTKFVGIETRRKLVQVVTDRAAKHHLSNIKVFHGDARQVLPRIVSEACLQNLFINFPDPWWKARHEKRMVVVPEVAEHAARLLVDQGQVFIQTDVEFRAEAYLEVLRGITELVPVDGDGAVESNPFGSRSLREVQCEKVGLQIYRCLFRRSDR